VATGADASAMAPPVTDGDGGSTITHFANLTPVVLVGGAVPTEIFTGQALNYPGIGQVNITIPDNASVAAPRLFNCRAPTANDEPDTARF
jgi:uncharacterized protein (TIGR03437 family)